MKFYLSDIADYCVEGEYPSENSITAETASSYGLGLELADLCICSLLDEKFPETLTRMEKLSREFPHPVLHAPYNEMYPSAIDPLVREAAFTRIRQAVRAAKKLGAEKIVVHSGFLPVIYYPSWFLDRSVDFWKTILAETDGKTMLCIENVLDSEPAMLAELVDRIGDDRFRITLDLGHANVTETDADTWIEILGDRISHVHVHNNHGRRDEHCAPGNGTLPAAELIRKIQRIVPEATFTIESSELRESAEWLQKNGFLDS